MGAIPSGFGIFVIMKYDTSVVRWLGLVISILSFFSASTASASSEFPGRDLYPNVPVISTQQLYKQLSTGVVIVDARTPFEYETLRIKGAINIPLKLNTEKFIAKIQNIRKQTNQPIVFYCNGRSCLKSYKAARKAMIYAKAEKVLTYDAGVFEWTTAYPDHAELLGKSPVSPDQLISKENFKKHMKPALDFIKSAHKGTIILDIRDRSQRDGFYIFSGEENSIPLNEMDKLKAVIRRAKKEQKPLFVYDEVGRQVRWLQYYLESEKVPEYYFMEGGAKAFFTIPINELMDS